MVKRGYLSAGITLRDAAKKGRAFLDEGRKNEELADFPMVIDCKENEDQGHPWPIRGRVIWVLNRFIEEPKK